MTIQTRNPNPPRTGATTVYLSAGEVELARALGGGNASAGVRLALATQVESILALAEKLPSGLPDAQAPAKLLAEMKELAEAIEAEDHDGALTEVADVTYYAAKCIALAAAMAGISRVEAFVVARAKYGAGNVAELMAAIATGEVKLLLLPDEQQTLAAEFLRQSAADCAANVPLADALTDIADSLAARE